MRVKARQIRKFSLIAKEIAHYIGQSALVAKRTKDPWERRRKRSLLIQKYSKRALEIMGVHVEVEDLHGHLLKDNALVVCNHMSYLDILVLSSVYPSLFVTSVEMKNTPGLGLLAELGGSLYVERRSRDNLGKEIGEITEALSKGLSVCVFPEATSTNGEDLLRFKRPLFNSARYAHKKILPVCLNYVQINEGHFSKNNRDLVCWYGDMDFLSHMWKLCGIDKIRAKLSYLEPISKPQSMSVSELADMSRETVRREFSPCL